jgi:hypothetical protein
MAQGRSRRNRVLGVAGGGLTAAVVAIALLAASPGPRSESLIPANPSPALSGTPATAAASARSGSAVAAERAAKAKSAAAHARQVGAATAASARPSPSPSRRAPGRPDFREAPREVAAPQVCRQPPSGQVGPVYSGSGSSCSVSSSGQSSVSRGATVTASIDECVAYGAAQQVLGYRTGQEHEVLVTDSRGAVVFRFSDTVHYTEGAHRRTLGEGRCLEWVGRWDTRYSDGRLVPAGHYSVTLSTTPDTVNGQSRPAGSSTTFGVDVS